MIKDLLARMRLPFQEDKELRQSLQRIMGFYPQRIDHYKVALTHKSSGQRNDKGRPLNNERLEFLGDAMLDAVVGHIVFDRFKGKREGFLTNTRSKLVSRESLGKLATEMGLTDLIQSRGEQRSHNSYMAGNAFEALVGAIYLDQGYQAVRRFMEKRILKEMVNIDKVAYKEVNFKSKLLEWTQKNRVRLEYRMLKQTMDEKGSPVFGFQVMIEGVAGGKAQGYSKKEAQQLSSKETLERLHREPQFIDAIFQAKSERTKMEEEPTVAAPRMEEDVVAAPPARDADDEVVESKPKKVPLEPVAEVPDDDEFDISDITHNPQEPSREDIIAAAEAAAFAEKA
ncbi:MAG: ribonuclease III [Prevotella sp.]|nr:ribonuclease III [Prevotella sp.]